MKKVISILLAAVAVSVLLFAGCAQVKNNGGTATPSDTSAALSGTAYINFTTKTIDGQSVDQSIFAQHKITFINYWATWCPPCVGELPDLQKLYEKYKDKIGFIGICDDATDSGSAAGAKKILDKSGDTYTNLMNFDKVTDIFGSMEYVPCSIIVDSNGKPLCAQLVGAIGNDKYSAAIDAALEQVK